MLPTPTVTDLETINTREGYQSLEPVKRPSYWGVDLDRSRRPGVPMERPPQLMKNAKFPIERQQGPSTAFMHGRTNKSMPPVFGTTHPPHGLSGVIKKWAATMPDHKPAFWLLKLLSDRVDSWGYHAKKMLPFALPLAAGFLFVRGMRADAEA